MKRILAFAAIIMAIVMVSCGAKPEAETSEDNETFILTATVIEASPLLVEPVEGSWELASADRIYIGTQNLTDDVSVSTLDAVKAGDTVCVWYDGLIGETYPAQINGAYKITLIDTEQE